MADLLIALRDTYSRKEQALLIEGSGAYRSKIQICCTNVPLVQTQQFLPSKIMVLAKNTQNAVAEFVMCVHLLRVTLETDFFQTFLPLVPKVFITV